MTDAVLPKGINAVIQEGLMHTYLTERDEYRKKRQVDPIWISNSSMIHAAEIYGLRSSTASLASTKTRIIYDKGFHGGNRAKDERLSDEDREATRACILCGNPDSQDHWLHDCPFPACVKAREYALKTDYHVIS